MTSELTRQPMPTLTPAKLVVLPGDQGVLTGTVEEVGLTLHAMQRAGGLLSATAPTPTGVPGQVLVTCRLIPAPARAAQPRSSRSRRRRLPAWAWAAAATAGLASLGMLGWLVYLAAVAVAGLVTVAGPWLVAALILLALGGGGCTTVVTVRHYRG